MNNLERLQALSIQADNLAEDLANYIEGLEPDELNLEYRDIRGELATNPGPYTNAALNRDGGWWQRRLDQIVGVTIHHTLSNSPHATAEHYINKGGGRPTIPYTFWITQTGEILWCVALDRGLWHDHTGHENTNLSVGLAGKLHILEPPDVQLDAAVRLCVWAIENLPSLTSIEQVKGHRDHIQTICPGWDKWKERFYSKLREAIK
jgi:hypothetical protein